MGYAVAVLDIGKTNKKVQVYDQDLEVLESVYESFPAVERDGLEVEDVEGIERWFLGRLKEFSGKYPIKVISITTHGATGVCVGEDGHPSIPVVAYTNDAEEEIHRGFYRQVGATPEELQRETATTEIRPLINFGKLLYLLKQRYPDGWARTRHVLLYPQYFGYRLTGGVAADYTYVGCHSYLWDFGRWRWSRVAESLGIQEKLPADVKAPGDVLGTLSADAAAATGLPVDTVVTLGVHDSNSSLIPYLIKESDDFVLNSTGTWCVAMHPMERVAFTDDEIGKMVFFNISALKQPVKTSILMGGQEFETYTEIIKRLNDRRDFPEFDKDVYERIIGAKELFIMPGVLKGTGQFPESDPRVFEGDQEYSLSEIQAGTRIPEFFRDYESAYAVINLSLAIQTKVALERVSLKAGSAIYVEGGFRKNPDYNKLLTAFQPESDVYLTDIQEATAFGAALLGKSAYEKTELTSLGHLFEIETQAIPKESFAGLEKYERRFFELL